jgi:hypothetical protein
MGLAYAKKITMINKIIIINVCNVILDVKVAMEPVNITVKIAII